MRFPAPSELVSAAKKGLGVSGDKQLDLALYSRYGVSPGQPQVNKWANNRGRPSYEYTLVLLHAAGWLNADQGQPTAELDAAAAEAREAEERARDLADRGAPPQRKKKPA